MPTNSVTDAFARWLASPPPLGMYVETMQFLFPGSTLAICNRRFEPLRANDENGLPIDYTPLPFSITKPSIRNSTELMIQARVDGVNGTLLKVLTGLSSDVLRSTTSVVLRDYIDPQALDRPVRTPLVLRLEMAKVAVDVVEVNLVSGRLPNKRTGVYYTIDRFPGVRPF